MQNSHKSLEMLIPGIYTDGECIYVYMSRFLTVNNMRDTPVVRFLVLMDMVEIFADLPIFEITEWHQ